MTQEAMLGCLERMIETCLELKAELEQERERREKKRDERKEAKERRDKEEPKKGKELTTTTSTSNAGARTCVYAYEEHPTIADVETHCVLKHVDKSYAKKWLDFIESEGWHFASGALVTRYNFRPSFNAWYKRELAQQRVADATTPTTPSTTKSWKEREFEAREAEIKRRQEEANRKAREEGLRILDEIKRNGGL